MRDLDLLRQLVGDEKLNYLGYSYGTQIGAIYAELFPQRIGRLVLDAAVEHHRRRRVIQAMGFDLALGNFATWCAAPGLHARVDQGGGADTDHRTVRAAGRAARSRSRRPHAHPDPGGHRDRAYLYGGTAAWPLLVRAIAAAIDGNGDPPAAERPTTSTTATTNGHYGSMFYSLPGDRLRRLARTTASSTRTAVWQEDQQKAPIFGKYFGPHTPAPLWPVRPARSCNTTGAGADAARGDRRHRRPRHPLPERRDDGRSNSSRACWSTYEGEGHGSYGGKSDCVDKIVIDLPDQGEVPPMACSALTSSPQVAATAGAESAAAGCPYSWTSPGDRQAALAQSVERLSRKA